MVIYQLRVLEMGILEPIETEIYNNKSKVIESAIWNAKAYKGKLISIHIQEWYNNRLSYKKPFAGYYYCDIREKVMQIKNGKTKEIGK
jgi:hypothetical protein